MDKLEIYMETQRLAVVATAAIESAMKCAGLRRSQLAEKLVVPRSRVTKVLDGETNMTLKTLAQFGLACNVRWQFVGVDASDSYVVVTSPKSLHFKVSRSWSLAEVSEVRLAASSSPCTASNASPDLQMAA